VAFGINIILQHQIILVTRYSDNSCQITTFKSAFEDESVIAEIFQLLPVLNFTLTSTACIAPNGVYNFGLNCQIIYHFADRILADFRLRHAAQAQIVLFTRIIISLEYNLEFIIVFKIT